MGLLAGKAVVITGAGQRIGGVCAKGVANQGAALVVNDTDPARAEAMVYIRALEDADTGVRVNPLSPVAAGVGMSAEASNGQKRESNSAAAACLLSEHAAGGTGQFVRIDRREIHLYTHPVSMLGRQG